jgi:hypothetical protein
MGWHQLRSFALSAIKSTTMDGLTRSRNTQTGCYPIAVWPYRVRNKGTYYIKEVIESDERQNKGGIL